MTLDNGMDNPLPISKEGLLAAIDTAKDMLLDVQLTIDVDRSPNALTEIEALNDYLKRLYENIEQDRASYYPPVVRK